MEGDLQGVARIEAFLKRFAVDQGRNGQGNQS